MKKYNQKTNWFNAYTKYILPFFLIISIINIAYSCATILLNIKKIESISLLILACTLDVIHIILSLKTTIDVSEQKEHSIKLLLILLGYNWIYKSLGIAFTYIDVESFSFNFLLALVIFSIYYIPNIIYFYHRIDIFEDANIENLDENDNINIIENNSNKKTNLFCTNCGEPINEHWNFCNYCGHKLK